MSWLTRIALNKRWLTLLIAALVTGGSIYAIFNLKTELIPDIEFPMTTVMASYPGASPQEVNDQVTEPIETEILQMGGIKHVTSTSANSLSFIFAQFEYGTDMDQVNSTIGQKLDEIELPDLPLPPNMAQNPVVIPLDLSMMPVVMLSLVGSVDQETQNGIADRFEAIAGVKMVEVEGNSPDVVTRTNGQPSLGIMVFKDPEANTVDTANAVVNEAGKINEELAAQFGGSPELLTTFDQSEYIERGISDLTRDALIGGALAILVIFLFLMTWRASFVTAISIPLSILIGFLIMYFWGITINLLTLSAMAIAVGRVIDDSIVLLEVIYRRRQQGEGFKEAAINGAREVATPITSATIATVAIFIPLIFVGGIVGQLFIPFALTITFAMLASLLVALTVVPALSRFITVNKPKKTVSNPGREPWYQRLYTPVLKWALTHRAWTLVIAAVLFFGSFALLPIIGTSFLPEMSEKMLTVEIEMPLGTPLADTDNIAKQVEGHIEGLDDVKIYQSTVGASAQSLTGAFSIVDAGDPNTIATITVSLDPDADLEGAAAALRSASNTIALPSGSSITISTGQEAMAQEMGSSSLEISISGTDYGDIKATATELIGQLTGMGTLENIESDAAKEIGGVPLFIRHYDGQRSVRVMAIIEASDVGAVNRQVQGMIDNLTPRSGVNEVEMGGVAESMREGFSGMYIAIGLAIVISYAVIVFFMRSFINPLIIMFSLPLASIGVLLGLLITGRPLGISAMMGILMLVGIVLTNAIVLIAVVEQLRKGGMSTFDALVEGGRTRLRPILMTALTTMLALFPLALGLAESTLLAAELGTVVIGGLFTSTLLTLLVIPVIYSLVEGLRRRLARHSTS